eukprot:TRINITY_DN6360_c1_g1_i12.p1 TRINITY_DN6360_c1_g1~~TRINITY_DN6360_c1_g1_i12.p1  ORF type:complete len:262 (-),score=64.79 TRINITY_DN6360_c1_g1_i12:87-872(-)
MLPKISKIQAARSTATITTAATATAATITTATITTTAATTTTATAPTTVQTAATSAAILSTADPGEDAISGRTRPTDSTSSVDVVGSVNSSNRLPRTAEQVQHQQHKQQQQQHHQEHPQLQQQQQPQQQQQRQRQREEVEESHSVEPPTDPESTHPRFQQSTPNPSDAVGTGKAVTEVARILEPLRSPGCSQWRELLLPASSCTTHTTASPLSQRSSHDQFSQDSEDALSREVQPRWRPCALAVSMALQRVRRRRQQQLDG